MKRVLVTGASGFLGRHCLPLLRNHDYEIHAVSSRQIDATANTEVSRHVANLLDAKQVQDLIDEIRPTDLLHLAWYTVPGKYWQATENLEWLAASLMLVRLFTEQGGERAVIAGTCAEYEWREGSCSEQTTVLAPATLYGTSKHALQLVLAAYAKEVGLSTAWGRLFFPYGPHERPERFVPSVIRALLGNRPAQCSHGNQKRDFLFVEDAAAAMVALLDSKVSGPVNIGSGEPVALRDVAYKIGNLLNRSELLRFGEVPVAPDDPPLLVADVTRLEKEVGWTPQYDLDRGLRKTLEWWQQSGMNQGQNS
jgi:nucleoside-diphosphate-sugar epimerase